MTDTRTGKPGLRERKKLEAQQAIRSAALRLFTKHGYETVSVEQIATAANVSRSTFFNYFPSKDAVLLEPDPGQVQLWQQLWSQRPAAEPLWRSLTAVLLASMEQVQESIRALKQLKATSPGSGPSLHSANDPLTRQFGTWVQDRVPAERQAEARLQINVALAALTTAFEDWDSQQPFEAFLDTARRYLDQLSCAFPND
jgi:AcrR family transcriptional regulator